jgi:hypothetical protein
MAAIFPDPLPDELLYSVIARHAACMCYSNERAVLRAVFGTDTHTAVQDLPTGLGSLVARLPSGHPYTTEGLIYEHTTLPYYRWFISMRRAERAEQVLRAAPRGTLMSVLGIMAGTVPSTNYLQFCPHCLEADVARYGFAYWHRTHQLPGVLVCPTHAVPLRQSPYARASRVSRRRFYALNQDVLPGTMLDIPAGPGFHILLQIAEDTLWLLRNFAEAGVDLLPRYRALAAARDYARDTGYVWVARIRSRMIGLYGEDFLSAMGCAVAAQGENWLNRLVRKSKSGAHPLQHILLCRLLGVSVRYLLTLNPAELRQLTTDTLPDGESTKVVHSRPAHGTRMEVPTQEWEARLRLYVADQSLTLAAMAKMLGVCRTTVQRHAKRLGVWRPGWQTSRGPRLSYDERREKNRTIWETLRVAHPTLSRCHLGVHSPNAYQWLIRNDWEWLNQNSPPVRPFCGGTARIDWSARDTVLFNKLQVAVAELKAVPGKPIRITRRELSRQIGEDEQRLASSKQLPRTAALLTRAIEPLDVWHARKLWWAFEQCKEQRHMPPRYRFLGLASIRPGSLPEQTDKLVSELLGRLQPADEVALQQRDSEDA